MVDYFGTFSGNPTTEWLDEAGADRRMKLLDEFWYEDTSSRRWVAPKGSVFDGASIPTPLWSVVGSPYTGEYRRASIIHDIACDNSEIPRKDADKMFYFACLAGGCAERQAQLMYAGVRIGAWAPSIRLWSNEAIRKPEVNREGVNFPLTNSSIQVTFQEIAADIQAQPDKLPFEALEHLVDRHLSAKAQQ